MKAHLLLEHYTAQRQAGLTPRMAFTAADELRWIKTAKAYEVAWPEPLRPHFTEAEMTGIAASPVVLIDNNRLPHNHMGNSQRLSADQADERNESINRQLKQRGISLTTFIEFESAGDHAGSCCYHLGREVSPSIALRLLLKTGQETLASLPAPLRGSSHNSNRLTVMMLPAREWHPASVWLDYFAGSSVQIERLPLSSDKSLILQLHEMGHTRQHILVSRSRNEQHSHEIGADDYAYSAYAALNGPAATIAASKAATVLQNFLRYNYLQHTHLTAPHVCMPDARQLFPHINDVRTAYKKLHQRVARQTAHLPARSSHGATRLRALQHLWNSHAKLPAQELALAGLTLEAAQLYCPRLMRATSPRA